MFDGVPSDQFHQFIASRAPPLPLSFPLHGGTTTTTTFPSFDPFPPPPPHQSLQSHLFHPLHHPSPTQKNEEKNDNNLLSTNLELERDRSVLELGPVDPWSNDEVLALLKVRSSMENWFTDFTWEHVSRRLAELGFKRSAEKCKEKFEEESRYFDSITYNKSYRFFSDLEELCTHEESNAQVVAEKIQKMEKTNGEEEEEEDKMGKEESRNEETLLVVANPTVENNREVARKSKSKKRKRHQQKFEMLKGFCEDMVGKLMARQQELHNKLLEDMVRRDEENIAREEAWKKQEMDRINKEIEIRAHEQAIASDRQATIIDFLKKLTSKGSQNQCLGERNGEEEVLEVPNSLNPPTSPSLILAQNKVEVPTSSTMGHLVHQNPSSCPSKNKPNVPTSSIETLAPQNPSSTHDPTSPNVPTSSSTLSLTSQNPNSFNTQNNPLAPTSFSTNNPPPNPIFESNNKENHGKRWPRDEVLALINLRCNLYSSGEDKEGAKGPLWERISQGMLELGYKRSAKRCKEKWENINKYFRKTKDANKKRSLDSRTCPYFHQLSHLYKQGTLVAPSDQGAPENCSPSSPENHSNLPETRLRFSHDQGVSTRTDANMHVADQGEKSMLQVPGFDFEF